MTLEEAVVEFISSLPTCEYKRYVESHDLVFEGKVIIDGDGIPFRETVWERCEKSAIVRVGTGNRDLGWADQEIPAWNGCDEHTARAESYREKTDLPHAQLVRMMMNRSDAVAALQGSPAILSNGTSKKI